MVRLVSGVLLATAVVAAVRFLPVPGLIAIAATVAALAAHEYLRVAGSGALPRQVVGIAATVGLCVAIATRIVGDPAILLIGALAWVAVDVLATGRDVRQSAADLLAPVYVGVPLGLLVVVHVLEGWQATLLAIAVVIVSDSAQYYVGRTFGRRPLAPAISPKKTVEGAVGGVAVGGAFMMVAGRWPFPDVTPIALAGVGALFAVVGIAGDLFESRLKRAAGVKDSAALIPGHGGMLDRIDALLFVGPAFYLFVRLLVHR
jgi:phosphatidate cytidylyltransferase